MKEGDERAFARYDAALLRKIGPEAFAEYVEMKAEAVTGRKKRRADFQKSSAVLSMPELIALCRDEIEKTNALLSEKSAAFQNEYQTRTIAHKAIKWFTKNFPK
jgi:16S rRNA G527 N7-methylase RsmG